MLPGDIDLTENLDFRNIRRKQIPKFPTLWKKEKEQNKKSTSYSNSYSTNINITTSYSNSYSTNINISTDGELYYYNFMGSTSNGRELVTLDVDNRITLYTSNINYINKDEYDIFGYKKTPEEIIPKIPWKIKTSDLHYCIPPIPWNQKNLFLQASKYVGIPSIPWDIENYREKRIFYNRIDRIKNLICYLKDKSGVFIKNYLDGEDVDMTYLTNMGWIRVRDAIID